MILISRRCGSGPWQLHWRKIIEEVNGLLLLRCLLRRGGGGCLSVLQLLLDNFQRLEKRVSGKELCTKRISYQIVLFSRIIKGRWVRHSAFHNPSFGIIFCAYEVFNFPTLGQIFRPINFENSRQKGAYASDGTCPGARFASQYLVRWLTTIMYKKVSSYPYLFALVFPHFSMLANCSSVHVSRSTDLTMMYININNHLSSFNESSKEAPYLC